jgi:hypothetical protein
VTKPPTGYAAEEKLLREGSFFIGNIVLVPRNRKRVSSRASVKGIRLKSRLFATHTNAALHAHCADKLSGLIITELFPSLGLRRRIVAALNSFIAGRLPFLAIERASSFHDLLSLS